MSLRAALHMATPQRLANELSQRSLRLASGTLSGDLDAPAAWAEMRERTSGVCDVLTALDAHYVAL